MSRTPLYEQHVVHNAKMTTFSGWDMPMHYAIYDPTYYIEMVHAETDQAITLVNAPGGCRAAMKQPNPDPEQIMLAASLDRTQSAGDGLGRFFAEDVSLTCD